MSAARRPKKPTSRRRRVAARVTPHRRADRPAALSGLRRSGESDTALRRLAEAAARAAGEVAERMTRSTLGVRLKADRSEVTDADEAAQAAAIEVIRAHRPDDAFIAEEPLDAPAPAPAAGRLCWAIDPIDGTRNYIRRIPLYGASIGVLREGRPVAGAIYAPAQGELFSAGLSDGFFLNGRRVAAENLEAQRRAGLKRSLLVGVPSNAPGPLYDLVHACADRCVVRNLGAVALHLAWIAIGRLHATLVSDSKLWDVAAGEVMLRVTGGGMRKLDGQDVFPLDLTRYGGEALPSIAACDDAAFERIISLAQR